MWLAVTAAVGAVCLVLCRAGRMKKRTALLAVLLGFYLAVIVTFTLGHRIPKQGYDYNSHRVSLAELKNLIPGPDRAA